MSARPWYACYLLCVDAAAVSPSRVAFAPPGGVGVNLTPMHKRTLPPLPDGDDGDGYSNELYTCDQCPCTTPFKLSYQSHMKFPHEVLVVHDGGKLKAGKKRLYMCPHCPHMGTEKPSMRMHIHRWHGDVGTKPVPAPPLSCSRCAFKTMLKLEYRDHLLREHGIVVEAPPSAATPSEGLLTSMCVCVWVCLFACVCVSARVHLCECRVYGCQCAG